MVAILAESSSNKKIAGKGKVSATYAATNITCPSSCSLRHEGCYAEYGPVGLHVMRLNEQATPGMRPEAVARVERDAMKAAFKGGRIPQDGAAGGRDLRLHVSGDARTRRSAKILAEGVRNWLKRGGGTVWSYTHGWKVVPRKDWGKTSILASMEDPALAKEARKRGYAPALVVGEHKSDKAYQVEGSDVTWIPCVAQIKEGVACSDCRLCMKADWLRDTNRGIAFAAHGVATKKIRKHLTVLA